MNELNLGIRKWVSKLRISIPAVSRDSSDFLLIGDLSAFRATPMARWHRSTWITKSAEISARQQQINEAERRFQRVSYMGY